MKQQPDVSDLNLNKLQHPGRSVLVGTFLSPFIQGVLLFTAAGTANIPRVWFLLFLNFVCMFGQIAIVAVKDPELVNHRGLWNRKKDAKPWDRWIVSGFGILSFQITSIVVGLDLRFGGVKLDLWSAVAGTVLFLFGAGLITWSMLVNTHFETVVRIQTDRNHTVISTGPYAVIRHPGYVGASLWALSAPLIVGSIYGLIPAGMAAIILFIRTILEDRTLHRELSGYSEYAKQVRCRWIPGLW